MGDIDGGVNVGVTGVLVGVMTVGMGMLGVEPGSVAKFVAVTVGCPTTVDVAVVAPTGAHISWPMLRVMPVRQLTCCRYSTGIPPAAAIFDRESFA